MEFISRADGPYVLFQGKKYLNFSSYDFLGLTQHPDLKRGTIKYILKQGVGVVTAPLKSLAQQQLEEKLAQALKLNQVLIFSSLDRLFEVLVQKDFLQISIEKGETTELLGKKGIVMDASLAIGVSGETGFEVLHGYGQKVDFVVGSLAFGLGCNGAFIASDKDLQNMGIVGDSIDFPTLGALNAAIDLIPQMSEEREKVRHYCNRLREEFLNRICIEKMISPRLKLYLKSEEEAVLFWKRCFQNEIFLLPPKYNEVFLLVTALHSLEDLDQLVTVFRGFFVSDNRDFAVPLISIS